MNKLTPARLKKLALLLYGPPWQRELAKALNNIHRNTVYYWVHGQNGAPPSVPDYVSGELKKLLEARKKEIEKAIDSL